MGQSYGHLARQHSRESRYLFIMESKQSIASCRDGSSRKIAYTIVMTDFMDRAIELSRKGMEAGEGGPFGAVVVQNGRIIAEGNNRVLTTNDPTAHAETVAIRRAIKSVITIV